MIKVSIIVPIYNSEEHLSECLNSLVKQSYINIQIILVNDGSTDKSIDICKAFALKDNRIEIIDKMNEGVSAARNAGLKKVKGKFVAFVDSDDYIDINMIKYMSEILLQKDADLVVCGFTVFKKNNIKTITFENAFYNNKDEVIKFFSKLEGRTNSPCNKIYKMDLIKSSFNEEVIIGEDLMFNLDYLEKCNSIVVVDKNFYWYRNEDDASLSNSYHDNLFEISVLLHYKLVEYAESSKNITVNLTPINLFLLNNTINYLSSLISREDISFKNKLAKIKNIIKNKSLRKTLNDLESLPRKLFLAKKILNTDNALGILIMFKFISFFKST